MKNMGTAESMNKWRMERDRWKAHTRNLPVFVETPGIDEAVAFLGTLGSEMLPWNHALV